MRFEDFSTVDFPSAMKGDAGSVYVGFIYVLCWVDGAEETPFYVGETHSLSNRMNDYFWADFQASTDFRVGEAVKYLNTRNLRVVARYKVSADREKEERAIINALHEQGRCLLNDLRPSYDYRIANQIEEGRKIHQFIDGLMKPLAAPRIARHNGVTSTPCFSKRA